MHVRVRRILFLWVCFRHWTPVFKESDAFSWNRRNEISTYLKKTKTSSMRRTTTGIGVVHWNTLVEAIFDYKTVIWNSKKSSKHVDRKSPCIQKWFRHMRCKWKQRAAGKHSGLFTNHADHFGTVAVGTCLNFSFVCCHIFDHLVLHMDYSKAVSGCITRLAGRFFLSGSQ